MGGSVISNGKRASRIRRSLANEGSNESKEKCFHGCIYIVSLVRFSFFSFSFFSRERERERENREGLFQMPLRSRLSLLRRGKSELLELAYCNFLLQRKVKQKT